MRFPYNKGYYTEAPTKTQDAPFIIVERNEQKRPTGKVIPCAFQAAAIHVDSGLFFEGPKDRSYEVVTKERFDRFPVKR